MARDAVFRSWQNERAKTYRRINHIDDWLGTAVNVQAMVFGNLGDNSGTGVGFTRNPATGEKEFFGEYLMNAQGEDVVSGVRTPIPISELEEGHAQDLRAAQGHHHAHGKALPRHAGLRVHHPGWQALHAADPQRQAHRPRRRSRRHRHGREGLITQEEAIFRVEANQLYDFLVPRLVEKGEKIEVLATGLPASPGAAVGQIVFTAEEAVKRYQKAPKTSHPGSRRNHAGRYCRHGSRRRHSHLARRHDHPRCCRHPRHGQVLRGRRRRLRRRREEREIRVKGKIYKQGDWISLDGTTGRVIAGKLKTLDAQPDDPDLVKFMSWVDPLPPLGVRANADIPRDAKQARAFGAEGIGLCRTEHMFFAEDRMPHMRTMILANDEKDRRAALKKLLPMQRADFVGLFKRHGRLPVTIRLLDPPLHEFLPRREDLLVEIAHLEDTKPRSPKLKELRTLLARVEELHEVNPMLGLRGCRLGITFPRSPRCRRAPSSRPPSRSRRKGGKPQPEIMIPLIGSIEEMRNQAAIVRRVAEEVFAEKKPRSTTWWAP